MLTGVWTSRRRDRDHGVRRERAVTPIDRAGCVTDTREAALQGPHKPRAVGLPQI